MTTITNTFKSLPVAEPDEMLESPLVEAAPAKHPDHLAHHFQTSVQQFEAAKLGMWIFLATEVLLFGGLFCLYAVFRHNHPEMFRYGSRFLDTNWGALNTVVLILSSLTMAWAVRCAQLNQRKRLVMLLLLTILGGATFMGVKFIEYSHKFHQNLVWGEKFYQEPHTAAAVQSATVVAAKVASAPAKSGNADIGKTLWMATCRSCHGVAGEGMPGQGKDLRGSEFIAGKNDKDLVAFIKVGRMPFDKLNTTGIQMPPKGGNPLLTDDNLTNIVAYVRTFKKPDAAAVASAAGTETGAAPATNDLAKQEEFFIPKSSVPYAPPGPAGLAANWDGSATSAAEAHGTPTDPRRDPNRPANAHLFFGIYFLMTGLHGFHVLIGMIAIGWLTVRAMLGHFTPAYFTPVDLVGLYWHVVDLIWIFLFPLLYLIH